ncbi:MULTISPECIES: adenylate/guanylate cyclase domain-containing protein [Aurantimonas]|jgi:adenylate cyclase|uniref:adenylate/guanylate cyclase domain-containing protein n=1 Tax=Aurantimonas TaxID=182269 RepID=UPI00041B3356|nr:adenylate/guanylate cyclase domain-containing protein [Aurantimonas coralicida]
MGLAKQVDDWLLKQSLGKSDIQTIFRDLCLRLTGIGVPIARARLNWPTLHPLFRAEMVKWHRDEDVGIEHFHHQDANTDAWQRSPLRYMVEADIPVLRRRLSGPGKLLDFAILEELAAAGYTDYIALKTEFSQPGAYSELQARGIIVIWASDRASGFTDEDLDILQEIQLTFALVCKTIIQSQIMTNIVETYLGRKAGRSVLDGNIRLGDGARTKALVWYSDLRDSTRLTGTLDSDAFLKLLNDYFECATRPALEAGGEVLAFIGDAVLVIFPLGDGPIDGPGITTEVQQAVAESFVLRDATNAVRRERGLDLIEFGVGLNVGSVVFGNIGVPERLAFTVIGSTVTEVERIEKLTKTVETNVLASAEVAALSPDDWVSVGAHALNGVERRMELFTPRRNAAAAADAPVRTVS